MNSEREEYREAKKKETEREREGGFNPIPEKTINEAKNVHYCYCMKLICSTLHRQTDNK